MWIRVRCKDGNIKGINTKSLKYFYVDYQIENVTVSCIDGDTYDISKDYIENWDEFVHCLTDLTSNFISSDDMPFLNRRLICIK